MPFPKHNILQDNELINKFWEAHERACNQKRIGFTPYAVCDFFIDMQVLQIFSERRKEYVYGIYFNGKNCGLIYTGSTYSDKDLQAIKSDFVPVLWNDIDRYIREKEGVWYHRYPISNFAWIYDRIITKTS